MKIKVTQLNGILLGLSLLFILPIFIGNSTNFGALHSSSSIIFVILVILSLLLCGIFFKKGNIAIFSPFSILICSMTMSYAIRPLYLVISPDILSFVPEIEKISLLEPLLLVLLFLIFFLTGYFCFKPMANNISKKISFPYSFSWIKERITIAIILLSITSFLSYLLMLGISGMSFVNSLIDPFAFRLSTTAEGIFYISAIALWSMWSIFYILSILFLLKLSAKGYKRLFNFFLLVILFILLAFLTVPYGSRGYILIPIIGLLWILDSSKIFKSPLNLIYFIPVLFLMIIFSSVFGLYRDLGSESLTVEMLTDAINKGGIKLIIDGFIVRYDSFDFFSFVVDQFPKQDQNYLYGRSIIDFIIQPIPRFLLDDKAYKTSAYLTQTLFPFYPKTFTPEYGLIAELYINFWIPGIIAGATLFGVFIRTIEFYIKLHCNNPSFLFFCAPLTLISMSWFLSGFNSDASVIFCLNIFLNHILLSFITKQKKHENSAHHI